MLRLPNYPHDHILKQGIDVCVDLNYGELYWLVGSNGVGKSLYIEYLKSAFPDFFSLQVFMDQPPLELFLSITLKDWLTDWINFMPQRFKHPLDQWKGYEALDTSIYDKKIQELSGGENQWAKILLALNCEAKLRVFDEPLTFLDPKKIQLFWDYIAHLPKQDEFILIVSHDVPPLKSVRKCELTRSKNTTSLQEVLWTS